MASLSMPQRLILSIAAARADGAVLPLPDSFTVRGRARRLVLECLIKRRLIAERPARNGEPAWSMSEGGRSIALEITPEGRTLIGSADQGLPAWEDHAAHPTPSGPRADEPELDTARAEPRAVRAGTKQQLLIDLLSRPDGATIAEIQQTTGWQPHTARAAIAGLKKKSFAVARVPREMGPRAYRLTSKGAGDSDPVNLPDSISSDSGQDNPCPPPPIERTSASSCPPDDVRGAAEPPEDSASGPDGCGSTVHAIGQRMSPRLAGKLREHQHLQETLRSEFPEADDETLEDTLEGLTELPEMIAVVLRSHLQDLALIRGLKGRLAEREERVARFERRAEKKRQLATSVMQRAEIRKIMQPDFTASLRRGAPPLLVVDEGRIPEAYWKPQPAKLDRQSLLATLKAGQEVAGATLGEPGFSLAVRTK